MATRWIQGVAAALLASAPTLAPAYINYCVDPRAQTEWAIALARYPDDPRVQSLYAAWATTCAQIAAGKITLQEGIRRFGQRRARILQNAPAHAGNRTQEQP